MLFLCIAEHARKLLYLWMPFCQCDRDQKDMSCEQCDSGTAMGRSRQVVGIQRARVTAQDCATSWPSQCRGSWCASWAVDAIKLESTTSLLCLNTSPSIRCTGRQQALLGTRSPALLDLPLHVPPAVP